MQKQEISINKSEPYLRNVMSMSAVLFFVYLADAMLSDWVPSFLDERMGGPIMMGIIMSFSSLAGLVADLVFPQLLKKTSAMRLLVMAVISAIVFAVLLIWGNYQPIIWLAICAVIVWGIYYELLSFGRQQMVVDIVPRPARSSMWALLEVSLSMAYFLGPLIGGLLAFRLGFEKVPIISLAISLVALISLWLWKSKRHHHNEMTEENNTDHRFDLVAEIEHWRVLIGHVWPLLVVSLIMGLIDATYWTVGAILSDNLSAINWWGSLFLPLYMLPAVIVGIILQRLGIENGKKRVAIWSTMISGGFLTLMGISNGLEILLVLSFGAGLALAISWPMINAVYSDILSRMGREKKHMIGLSSSVTSLAYIVGPLLAGVLAEVWGYKEVFVVMGVSTIIVMLIILSLMPKKLKLPQIEIGKWS